MEQPLTQYVKEDKSPMTLKEYEEAGGYEAAKMALSDMKPEEITEKVKDANLKGRGGAGFPTGMKFSFMPMGDDLPRPKYLVVNADEMEPGTFKDRLLLESTPHQLIESCIISAYALDVDVCYTFLRWAYKTSAKTFTKAMEEAYEAGYLGENIFNTGFDLEMHLHTSVGRYMCGEETGLLNALEGRRATPRAKPPFPTQTGLFGKPTVVNNVETLCNIPHIVKNGVEWYKNLSKTDEGGTKLYGVSGKVKNPGLWELPLGTTMGEIINEHAGGMQDGLQFKGALPGGASTDFLIDEHMEVRMGYNAVEETGGRLGTGTIIVLDDHTCPVGFVHNLQDFFAQESCGWCTPCRDGLPWIADILQAIDEGKGKEEDLNILREHTKKLGPGMTFCALAPGAMEPLQSALDYFKEDFKKHIEEKQCPWNS